MTREEKLDRVLSVLVKQNLDYNEVYDFWFDEEEIKQELKILLEQIVQDRFASFKEIDKPDVNPSWGMKSQLYRITSEGQEFNRTSSYKEKSAGERKKKIWSAVEKVSVVFNGILLLVIAIGGLYLSERANEDKDENKQLKHKVDSLNNLIELNAIDTVPKVRKH